MSKQLWVLAGVNGSGKSSLVKKYGSLFKEKLVIINPDDIALEIDPTNATPKPDVQFRAGREALKRQEQLLKDGATFGVETTFSGQRTTRLLDKAKELGYKTNLVYIALQDPTRNVDRVSMRVQKGGHNIPIEDIVKRCASSRENFKQYYKKVDRVYVLDNSGKDFQICAKIIRGEVKALSKRFPQHIKELLPSLNVCIDFCR